MDSELVQRAERLRLQEGALGWFKLREATELVLKCFVFD